jgi:hypothetical protein
MAIRALNTLVVANFGTAAAASWVDGVGVQRDTATAGNVIIATRALQPNGAIGFTGGFAGFSADSTARTGNTMILADPVGSNYVDANGVLQTANNGFYSVAKRAVGDFFAENVNGVTNPTAGSSGYEGPRRGVGVFNTPGGQFVTDMFVATSGSNLTNGFVADTTGGTYATGSLLTVSATFAQAGKLVQVNGSGVGGTLPIVGVVDRFDSAAGLLYFTQK